MKNKQFAVWCVYHSRGDKWVRVWAHDKAEAREKAFEKEASRGIRSVYGVEEVLG